MDIKLNQAYSFHQIGHRKYQEDSRFPDTDVPNLEQRFFVVCDGVGGCEKGDVASQTVCESICKAMKDIMASDTDFTNESLSQMLSFAYDALDIKGKKGRIDMGTTLTFVCFHAAGCTMAHIGDSRIYQVRPSEGIIYRSDDHSLVNSLVHSGALTPEQAINHPQSNVITRYMEPVDDISKRCGATVMRTVDVAAGDYFFLCTDGVLQGMTDDALIEILSSAKSDKEKIQEISEMSKNSDDNNTAYLISVASIQTDSITAEATEVESEDSHSTRKIKFASQQIEEVESAKSGKTNSILKSLWRLLKKSFAAILLLFAVSSLAFCPQPVKKKIVVPQVAVDSAATILEKAKAGDAVAQNTVGMWYYTGKDSIKQDYKQALQWWARSAKQDNAEAIGNMAMCYQHGHGTEGDSAMATKLYEAAIKKGNVSIIPWHEQQVKNSKSIFSCLLLRECYAKGIGVIKDAQKASHYQETAAEAGHEASQFALALNALNSKQNDVAAKWFKKAADQGHVGATYYYGYLLLNGMGTAQNKNEAFKYLQLASEQGFATANYLLGKCYQEGNGADKDPEKAFGYMKLAARQGNIEAKWTLGNMYLKGEGINVDYYLATQWLAEVALSSHKKQINDLLKEDNEGTFSQYLMGLRNYFVDKNYEGAITCFNLVDKAKNPEGKTMLGLCYVDKDYSKQNPKNAFKLLSKAIDGSNVANYHLSTLYANGIGAAKDEKKAIELLTKAAEAGIAPAECELGDRYLKGLGVAQDSTKAAMLYLDAEAQNQLTPMSAQNLASCYKNKLSVLSDLGDVEKRIVKLEKQKVNSNLINLLTLLEK